jgi:catechol 2,3-dioxygenase-like lactoylglutathione lyase family enzyme
MNFGKDLAYIALVTNDVAAAAAVFGEHLGLSRTDCRTESGDAVPVFAIGESALALFPVGHPVVGGQDKPGVHHIALAVADPDAAAEAAARAGIAASPGGVATGLQGHRYRMLDPKATSGLRTYLSQPLAIKKSSSGAVERLDHIGVASVDNAVAIEQFCGKLGLQLESQQTDVEVLIAVESFTSDKYGVIYHNRKPEMAGAVRVAFITAGDCELEFLASLNADQNTNIDQGAPGNTRQDRNAIARFVASRGPGLHHFAFKTADINGILASLAKAGIRVIDKVGRPGSRRAQIGFVHPGSVGGFLFHFVQRS